MHTKIYITFLIFLFAYSASAQKNLVVYHVTGNVNLVSGNNVSVAKRGDLITPNNTLQVKPGADCMLIEEKGKSLQVAAAGVYTFQKLQKMLASSGKAGVTQKFFSYVYENMFKGKKGENLSVAPVVFRGDELMKLPSDNSIVVSDAFNVGWKKPAGKIPVHLKILDHQDVVIIDTVLKNSTSLVMNIRKYHFKEGSVYKWKTEESDTRQPKEKYFYFLIPAKNERKQIESDLKLLQDKKLTNELRAQVQHDIFQKWKQFYSDRN